jgi:hypothetical protein
MQRYSYTRFSLMFDFLFLLQRTGIFTSKYYIANPFKRKTNTWHSFVSNFCGL